MTHPLFAKERRLLIDDERSEDSPNIQRRVNVIARNYWEGVRQLQVNGGWDLLLLDHDLGSYEDPNDGHTEKTGYDIMCFLEEFPQFMPKKIELVTSNPQGRKRMQQVIDAIERRKDEQSR